MLLSKKLFSALLAVAVLGAGGRAEPPRVIVELCREPGQCAWGDVDMDGGCNNIGDGLFDQRLGNYYKHVTSIVIYPENSYCWLFE